MTNSVDDINKLKLENVLISKQYNSLLRQYNKVLKAAVENADSNEYCIQELEKKFEKVLDIAKTHDTPPCLNIDCDCDKCHDDITEYGKTCMQKGLKDIIKILQTEEGGIENKPDVSP